MKEKTYRIHVVDALRGFSILGILLMHSYEQFNLFAFPPIENKLLQFTDKIFSEAIPFLFAGKAYAVFALLFGFSFFIQDNHQKQIGASFRGRFLWRLFLLFLWGCLNSVFYTGDVLITFAILGIILPVTSHLPDKALFAIGLLFFFQPEQWIRIVYAFFNPDYAMVSRLGEYHRAAVHLMKEGNIIDMFTSAFSNQMYSFTWWIQSGRIYQVVALFLFGVLLARNNKFVNTEKNTCFWIKALVAGIVCYFPLTGLKTIFQQFIENSMIKRQLTIVIDSHATFAFFVIVVSVFLLTYYHHSGMGRWLSKLEPYGKMSLTMYISQSILGGFVFYNWGLGLAPYLSVTFSIAAGLIIFAIQYIFAVLWLKHHSHGPLEYVWKKLTWIGKK